MNVIDQEQAIKVMNEGFPIIFQTDTLPAIGCKPEFSETIYINKVRNKNKSLILMGAEISQLLEFVHESAIDDFNLLASKYWPGALTMVIPTTDKEKFNFHLNKKTLGLRIPRSSYVKSLIKESGPLATSSANISGNKTPTIAEEVSNNLPNVDVLGPIPWPKCSGEASTIISWRKKGKWKLLRKGQVLIPEVL